jgi:hypothetical protein
MDDNDRKGPIGQETVEHPSSDDAAAQGQPAPGTGPATSTSQTGPTAGEGAAEDTGDAVGNDNIREGRVGGLMGGPRQSQGQGQGG